MSKKTKNLRKQRRRELSEFEQAANRAAKMTYLAERTLGVVDKGSPMANYLDEMAADKAEYQKDPDAYRKKFEKSSAGDTLYSS